MTFRSIGVLLIFLVSILFIVVNWGPIMTPMPVSFILFTLNIPLGLFLIVGGGLVFLIALMWMLWKEAMALVDLQKANREAREARAEAAQAEGSRMAAFEKGLNDRFTELENTLTANISKALDERREKDDRGREDLIRSIESMQASLDSSVKALKKVEEQTNQRLI